MKKAIALLLLGAVLGVVSCEGDTIVNEVAGVDYDTLEISAAQCQDGQDNDGDGATDCDDVDCAGFVFCAEDGSTDADTDTDTDSDTDSETVESCVGNAMRACTCENGLESTQMCSYITETWGECRCDYVLMRFCHSVFEEDPNTGAQIPIELWISFDNGEDKVTMTAMSEECEAPRGEPCTLVPAGDTVAIEWGFPDEEAWQSSTGVLPLGNEYATTIGVVDGNAVVTAGTVDDAAKFGSLATDTCADFSIY